MEYAQTELDWSDLIYRLTFDRSADLRALMATFADAPFLEPDTDEETQLSSMTRQAYQRLRDRIVTLQLTPGALINEAGLMEELQMGRTPLREAMQRLACEGLVILRPRRGAFVAGLSLMDLQQIFELRRVLEGYAAALAAERATEADIASLEATLAELARVDQRAASQLFIEIDRAFHRGLARAAHNKYLENSLSRLYNLNLRLWYLALDKIGPMHSAVAQHRRVLQAIVARDSEQAAAAMREHISDFQTRVKDSL